MTASTFDGTPFLVLLHVSTTCDEHQVCVARDSAEVIEIAWSLLNSSTLEEISHESVLVRPNNTPITDLCTSSTGLTWADVEHAGSFHDAIYQLDTALQAQVFSKGADLTFMTFGSWDLRVQIPREARDKGVSIPHYLAHSKLYELRGEFVRWQEQYPDAHIFVPTSLANICASLDISIEDITMSKMRERNGHSGQDAFPMREAFRASDQCELALRILRVLMQRSSSSEQRSSLFRSPQDAGIDIAAFYSEHSKVLHLSGLAYDTTQSELESWFTQHGGRPIAFWTLRTPDQHKSTGLGYAVFSSHEEAADSLVMNGRALGDRTIEVSPSSPRILDRAAEILTPFPPSKNRPRPGDWTCPSCGFSNFQRRTACFRCSYPSHGGMDPMPYYPPAQPIHNNHMNAMGNYPPSSASSMRPMVGKLGGNTNGGNAAAGSGHVPFRAGDWSCQNCSYHNFARNSVCLKCSMPRAPQQQHHPSEMGMMRYDDYGPYSMGNLADDMSRM